jgi:hypothetical protein
MKLVVILCLFSLSLFAQDEESEALRAMRLSCERQKVALGCFNYANMLARLEKNEEADKAFKLGCKLGDSPSCKKEKWDLPAPVAAKVRNERAFEPSNQENTRPSLSDEPIAPPSDEPIAPPSDEPIAPPSDEPIAPPADEPIAPPADEPIAPPSDEPIAPPSDDPIPPPSEAESSVPESTDMSLDTGDTINQ